MEEVIDERMRRLKASLESIRGFLEWEKVNIPSRPAGISGGWSGLVNNCPDLKVEIGKFYLLYDDLRNEMEDSPKQTQEKWLPVVNNAWLEYFALVRAHPEIFH